jgi:hypothetical protein
MSGRHGDLIEYMATSLTEYELVMLLNEVFCKREKTEVDYSIPYYSQSRFILAEHNTIGDPDDLETQLLFIAHQDLEQDNAEYDRNIGLQQEGSCQKCGAQILSYAKLVICPVCDSKVGCT